MAYTYTQLIDIKNRIVRDLAGEETKIEQVIAQPTAIKNNLSAMQTGYTDWASQVDAYITANPNDEAAKVLKAERDLLVAEFGTAKTTAIALETAVDGV
jgi:uncharacterized iron-regulated protein